MLALRKSISIFLCCPLIAWGAAADKSRFSLSAQIGASNLHVGNSTLQVTPMETDTLHETADPKVPEFSLGINYRVPLNTPSYYSIQWLPDISAAINARFINQEVTGNVYQYQEPVANNYDYQISLQSLRLMLDGTITLLTYQEKTSVYLMGGIGDSWTQVGYLDSPISGVPSGALSLSNRTNSGFTYELGAGISYWLDKAFTVFLEYRYAHFPSLKTGSNGSLNGSPVTITPAKFDFYSQTVSLGIDWNFNC